MKILFMHNYYGSSAPSGENLVFESEQELLRKHGHEVAQFVRRSDEIRAKGAWGAIQGALSTPWNPFSASAVRRMADAIKPDVVHVHNTFPLFSPAIFHAIGHRAARVLTLHNYRLYCPAAIPMRNGQVCTECLDKHTSLPALQHGCYRKSRLATLPLALSVGLHRWLGTWERHVDAFITLSEFQKERMVEAGLPAARVYVKPNFFKGTPLNTPWSARDEMAVFAGRLSPEKGIEYLVKAWLAWGKQAPELRILGDGPLRKTLSALAGQHHDVKISFLGQVSSTEAAAQIARAKLLLVPSTWFEGFPMVLQEAFALGTPAAVSDLGPLPSIVHHGENGLVFAAGNPNSLLGVVRSAWESGSLEQLGKGARAEFETHYNEDVNYKMVMRIYDQAMSCK